MARMIIVGGSIAGLSCAHAAAAAGWVPTVLEKAAAPVAARSGTGAGLGLDPQACAAIACWVGLPDLHDITLPLDIDENRVTEVEKKVTRTLTRDNEYGFRAAHWVDLHQLLYEALPTGTVLWGHEFLSFRESEDDSRIVVRVSAHRSGETVEITGDLLVAADGCLSAIRQHFLPEHKLRYAGYCAWRGVIDFSEAVSGIQRAYPDLGRCLYFDLSRKAHSVLYELKNKRLNWLWYVNRPEPELTGRSVTARPTNEEVKKMHREAEAVWVPEFANLMKETKDPFLNVIYDSDPLPQLFWANVVLVGDAAHPTTPHGLRSTNMSILDAVVLGQCLQKWGSGGLQNALEEYQSLRYPVVSAQVLHSRKLGQTKQGLFSAAATGDAGELKQLQQKGMPYFFGAPTCSILSVLRYMQRAGSGESDR